MSFHHKKHSPCRRLANGHRKDVELAKVDGQDSVICKSPVMQSGRVFHSTYLSEQHK